METNRLSSAKWVSRRTLDSQAHNRDHSTAIQLARGHTPHGNVDNSNTNNNGSNLDRRKYRSTEVATANTGNVRGGGSGGVMGSNGAGGGSYRTNSGSCFGASNSGSSTSGAWNCITSNSGSGSISKLNHHGMGYLSNTVNSHPLHNFGDNNNHHHHHCGVNSNGGNGDRRGYGNNNSNSSGSGEAVEATVPPPPRSVQMGQGTLGAHAPRNDLIPQPRHIKVNRNFTGNPSKPVDRPSASPAPDIAASRRWTSTTSTPTPRSAHSNAPAAPIAHTAAVASHHDPHTVPRSSPSPSFTPTSSGDARTTAVPPLPPPAPSGVAGFGLSRLGGGASDSLVNQATKTNAVMNSAVQPPPPPPPLAPPEASSAPATSPGQPPSGAAPGRRTYTAGGTPATTLSVKPALTSPLKALHINEHLIFDVHDFDEPAAIQPSEIEVLLGQVERRTAAAANASKEASMGGSLRERRSAADWGIEEAIKSVLPGMDEDDNSDDMEGPNIVSSGTAAISGSWHTTGEPDARQPVGVGLLADFPTSFAASFSEPVHTVLGSPFAGDPALNSMDNLSRAFSTAARVDSFSFNTSPAVTSAATPPQRPPATPALRLPRCTSPAEVVAMPPSAVAVPQPLSALPPSAVAVSQQREPTMLKEEMTNDGVANTSDLLTLYLQSPPVVTSPWLASGMGESSSTTSATAAGPAALALAAGRVPDTAIDLAASKLSSGSIERTAEGATEKPAEVRGPAFLQSNPIKNGSTDSSFGLTASMSANSPAIPSTRQSTITTSAPNTPSLRKEVSTPLSTTRAQAYAAGGNARPQRPSLTAPLVNRHTITQIFRETPQSLQQKEAMRRNHENSREALCRDARWPPHNKVEAEEMLREHGAVKLLRHLTIIAFSRQNAAGVQELFDTWAKNGIPAPDMGFGAYYYYVKEKSAKLLCMKHNGRGPSPGHGYGRCDFESRRPYSTCRYEHVCLFCRSAEHGWFEEGRCEGYQSLLQEMVRLGVIEEDVVMLLNAMEKEAKQDDKQKIVR